MLDLLADGDATAALDATACIADQRGVGRPSLLDGALLVLFHGQAQVVGKLLQLAVSAAHAGGALNVMGCNKKLHVRAAGSHGLGGIGLHDHTVGSNGVASCGQLGCTLDLDDADAASADFVDVLQVAQGGDFNACSLSGSQDGGAFFDGNLDAIDGYVNHCH